MDNFEKGSPKSLSLANQSNVDADATIAINQGKWGTKGEKQTRCNLPLQIVEVAGNKGAEMKCDSILGMKQKRKISEGDEVTSKKLFSPLNDPVIGEKDDGDCAISFNLNLGPLDEESKIEKGKVEGETANDVAIEGAVEPSGRLKNEAKQTKKPFIQENLVFTIDDGSDTESEPSFMDETDDKAEDVSKFDLNENEDGENSSA